MGCGCNERTKEKIKAKLLEFEHLKLAKRMQDQKPSSLNDKQLLDYHKKTHMLYSGNITRSNLNKKFINFIVDLHNSFVKEMLKRGMKHNTPLNKV